MDPAAAILIVDDDPEILASLQAIAASAFPGLRVVTAQDAQEALEILDQGICRVVVSDYRLGNGMDGGQFLREVSVAHPPVKRIAISGSPDAYLVNLGRQNGFDVLAKPIDPALFVKLLRHHLK